LGDAESEGFAHFFASRLWNTSADPDQCSFTYYKDVLLDACPDGNKYECVPSGTRTRVVAPYALSCAETNRWRNNECTTTPDHDNRTVGELGVERDWLQFFWTWNRQSANSTSLEEMFEVYRQICNPSQCIDEDGARVPNCLLSNCADVLVETELDDFTDRPLVFEWGSVATVARPADLPADPPPTVEQQMAHDLALQAYFENQDALGAHRSYRDGAIAYYTSRMATGDPAAQQKLVQFLLAARINGVDDSLAP
jgi:hypothetical protein